MEYKADLHIHSTYSDGKETPLEIARIAKAREVGFFAITDHDTIAGCGETIEAAKHYGLWTVPAVEISVDYFSVHCEPPTKEPFELHLLGYGINPECEKLVSTLSLFIQKRNERLRQIFSNVNYELTVERKFPLDSIKFEERLCKVQGSNGRPVLARMLVDAGYAKDWDDAFERYLRRCNVKKEPFAIGDASALIREAGGIPVLAHPATIRTSLSQIVENHPAEHQQRMVCAILDDLKDSCVIDGIEAIHFDHKNYMQVFFLAEAERLDLFVTAGSDHHGGDLDRLGSIDATVDDVRRFVERFS